jgi:hypothetical protein
MPNYYRAFRIRLPRTDRVTYVAMSTGYGPFFRKWSKQSIILMARQTKAANRITRAPMKSRFLAIPAKSLFPRHAWMQFLALDTVSPALKTCRNVEWTHLNQLRRVMPSDSGRTLNEV